MRRQAADSFDAVLTEVRAVPGFEGFLLPPTVEDLLQAAEQGPVAVITVDELRSDALLLTSRGLRHVPLPGLSPAAVAEQTVGFLSALDAISAAAPNANYEAEARVTEVLGWLWDVLAEPVLREPVLRELGIGTREAEAAVAQDLVVPVRAALLPPAARRGPSRDALR